MTNKIEFGDCRETMRRWKEQGIKAQTCVTSPPYYGLRDYGTAKWDGGDDSCEHSISMPTKWNDPKRGTSVLRPETAPVVVHLPIATNAALQGLIHNLAWKKRQRNTLPQ